jgi:UDP-GlcNAc:undecaprenyl-phosphate/decaprenyl-phosphate GlcNAc-1-phosphate transferase
MFTATIVTMCAICALATGILAYFGVFFCQKLGLMDVPGDRKLHATATPLLGGLALTCVILPLSIGAVFLQVAPSYQQSALLYVMATFAIALIGMADDRHSLSARDRILLAFLVFGSIAIVDPLFNVRVLVFSSPYFEIGLITWPIAVLFTAVCCVGLVNAVNMADGKNGLVIGLCLGWLIILSHRCPEPLYPLVLLLGTGLAVLLIFNLRGWLFLGDGGSYGFATAIGLLTIAIYNSPGPLAGRALAAEEAMLIFSIPVIDSFRLTFVRLRRGQSPMTADRDHLHHHLQRKFGWPGGLFVYLTLALVPPFVILHGR